MAAEKKKRDYSDFDKFDGFIDGNIYKFPLLKYDSKLEQGRQWQIFVRIVSIGEPITSIDWDLTTEKSHPIKKEYFTSSISELVYAQYWTETGISNGKNTRSAPSYVTKVTNKGKSNEHNVFQSALVKARNEYLKKKERSGNDDNTLYYPMLATKEMKFDYPVYVQPKLNGVRALATILDNKVIIYSRQRKQFLGMRLIENELLALLNFCKKKDESIIFDGELYNHGQALQDIVGNVRNESKEYQGQYNIFDAWYSNEKTAFKQRWELIESVFKSFTLSKIKKIDCKLIANETDLNKEFAAYTKDGYEGIIIRTPDGPYLSSIKNPNSLRSKDVIKMKQKFDAEYPIVGFKSGEKGKDVGQVIWIVQVNDTKLDIVPNATAKERQSLYKKCQEDFEQFRGKLLTIEYEELSKEGVPLRARGIEIRDYE